MPTQNNGKITSQTDNVSGEQVVYAYDALNRLASATATSGAWGQSYAYDGFGNLTDQNVTAGSAPAYHVIPDPTTNHVGSVDANGNTLGMVDPNQGTVISSGSYDVENRFLGTAVVGGIVPGSYQYSYGPGNKRVWRGVFGSSGSTTILNTDEVTFWSVSGQKLGSYEIGVVLNAQGVPQSISFGLNVANYYFGGKLIGHYTAGFGLVTVGEDRLGSIGKYYPYGQEKPSATTNGTEKFTGYFRDSETGFDYADQRYHNPGTGRFLTSDPYQNSAGPTDPGSWNRYAYTRGDPVNRFDSTGLDDEDLDDGDDGGDFGGGDGGGGGGDGSDQGTPPDSNCGYASGSGVFVCNTATPGGALAPTPSAIGTLLELLSDALNGIGGVVGLFFFSSTTMGVEDTFQTNPAWIEANCTPTGTVVKVPSTQPGNKGGWSIETEYDWKKQGETEKQGNRGQPEQPRDRRDGHACPR